MTETAADELSSNENASPEDHSLAAARRSLHTEVPGEIAAKALRSRRPQPLSTSVRADGVALPGSTHWRPEMSITLSTIARLAGMRRLGASLRILNANWERIARYFVHRAAMASLYELDDGALRDIGLVRSEIEAAVHGVMTASTRARL
jgi:uncharacterized protein YjiS (DUF1127 family)